MSAIENMKKRLDFNGGDAYGRMVEGKLQTLKKAILYSYQSATISLNGKEFRCLINPDKLKPDYDNKILSIPFEDIQLNAPMVGKTSEGQVPTEIKPGDVFYWPDDNSYWIVYLPYHEERAYFRADIRRCKKETTINGKTYKVYYRGPVETTIPWNQKKGIVWNTPNYSAIIYITKDENTLDYFHRFNVIKIDGNPWEIKAVDSSSGEGIIEVQLKETFKNEFEDARIEAEKQAEENKPKPNSDYHINGDDVVYPYDVKEYEVVGLCEGTWSIDNEKKVRIVSQNEFKVKLQIIAGKSGNFNLTYTAPNDEIVFPITIKSL